MALAIPSELGCAFLPKAAADSTAANTFGTAIGLSTTVGAVGYLLVGIAVLQARVWKGAGRFTPLLCGVFVLVVLVPVRFIEPSAFLWPVCGRSLCYVLLGLALLQQVSAIRRKGDSEAR